jgi:hypothetical protein
VQNVLVAEIKPHDRELEIRVPPLCHTEHIDIPISGGLKLGCLNEEVF